MTSQPKQISSSPLESFCNKHGISLAKLSDLCGGKFASRSTVHRLVKNELTPSYKSQLNKKLAESLPKFLAEKGFTSAEIDEQLVGIFDEGEYQPMINQRIELRSDELKWFGLTADPFTRTPQSREEVFISPSFQQIIDRVIDAVQYQGFVSVTGPIGSGKSTLRALVEDHVEQNPNLSIVWPEFFDMNVVSPMQIAAAILNAFEMKVPASAERRGKAVKDLLANLYKDGKRIAIGFDECHRLSDKTISSLKNFFEMSSGGFRRYLGVILFGQPIFASRLRAADFQEIVERVVPMEMPEFSQSAEAYLTHRLQLVGADVRRLFDKEALELICGQARTPLQLGNIANEALRISKSAFKNTSVVGSAIKTKMYFETQRETQGFRVRKAS